MNADITKTLQEILEKVTAIEAAVIASPKASKTSADAVLREKLDRLTLKRHAVLTATIGDVGYAEIAKTMECDQTTVKIHLKGALQLLGIPSRSILLAQHKKLLDVIPDKEYEVRYGIGKRWWLERSTELMNVLTATKAGVNQHTKTS